MRDLLQRMRALEHGVHDAAAARSVPFNGGVAYFDDDLPHVWDVNFVRVDSQTDDLVRVLDELQAGQGHRKVLIEDPLLVEAHAPELQRAGLARRDLIAMARAPGGTLDPDVGEATFGELRDFRLEMTREQLSPPSEQVAREVVAVNERMQQRWLVIHVDGEPAGHLIVYSHDGLAQLEDVAVLRRYQGRGLARRLIGHALELVAADHDAVFIVAESDNWPRELYARLGFEEIEDRADFLLIKAA